MRNPIPDTLEFVQTYDYKVGEREFALKLCQDYPEIKAWVYANQPQDAQPRPPYKIGARQTFIQYLNSYEPPDKPKKMNLLTLLGKEGFEKYKEAIKEEFEDPAFRLSIIAKAFKKYHGATQGMIPIIPLGGPSGSGKSTSAAQIVERFIPKNKDDPSANHDFAMAFVDGGIPREQNNMQKILKRYAELRGLRVSKFQKPSSSLVAGVKDDIRSLAYSAASTTFAPTQRPPVGVVEVETFSGDAYMGAKKLNQTISKKWNDLGRPLKVIMAIVGGDDPAQHPIDVRKMATFRSDPSDADLRDWKKQKASYTWEQPACRISGLKEYKSYGETGYVNGVTGSWKAALLFWNYITRGPRHNQDDTFQLVTVENPVKPYNEKTGDPWQAGDKMRVASPRVHAAAMAAMKLEPQKTFAQHCDKLWKDPKLSRLVMHQINPSNVSFPGLLKLLKKQMNYGTKTSALKTLMMQIKRGEKKALKKLFHIKPKVKYAWAVRNIPYVTAALELGEKLNWGDYHSVLSARKEIEAIMEKKRQSRGLLQKLFAWRSHMMPQLKKVQQQLKMKEYELYHQTRNSPIYHAQALAKTIGMTAESAYAREIFLQMAILSVHVKEVSRVLPASFVDYAEQNLTQIRLELDKIKSKFFSQQLLHTSVTSYTKHNWFKTYESELKAQSLVQAMLKKKQT